MKRTFGRFMSLLLVLAMVLAMVPAALAANQAYSVEPGSTIKIKTSIAGFSVTQWTSSDTSVATVTAVSGSTTEATVTGVRKPTSICISNPAGLLYITQEMTKRHCLRTVPFFCTKRKTTGGTAAFLLSYRYCLHFSSRRTKSLHRLPKGVVSPLESL